ncbi:MAG: hypothetical protein ACD_20C00022G0009 [uncultured bacterium]|nr:MAG: hypothetical protein ACD_20C00022G0009 [uncultured bacterium]HBH18279.1 bifunctional ADP-dependent NAD(P)H-hydrate dehydratase/NAD(P)H-hydrate epimerase [Cyanobacteria bacterium UBA9579]
MIKVLTGTQMRNIDKQAIEELKIPSLILMENAGRAVFEQVVEILNEVKDEHVSVLVICGKGNNGGDGFVAARHLILEEIPTYVLSLYHEEELSGDALANHNALKNFTDIFYYDELDPETIQDILSISTVVVDAIFGTGLNTEVKGHLYQVIDTINEFTEGYVVAVDIPSGIDSNTGQILGNAVVADYTVSLFNPKLGTILYPGAEHSGEIIINDIGIPETLLEDPEYNINLITAHYACANLPLRPEESHKGMFGSVFNVAGGYGMTGAAFLSAYSSLKVGAGYSMLATPESLVPIFATMAPEIVYAPLKETPNKTISKEAVNYALEKSEKSNIFLLGPGIGTDPSTIEFISEFTQKLTDRGLPAIFDADALNCFTLMDNFVLPINSVITPHPKELARLLKVTVKDIMDDRIGKVREAAQKFNTIVVLKGARTIIAEPNGTIYINPTGNSALATAGTGDVLCGMIAGFAAQGLELRDAAILGVYLHGLAGDLAEQDLTQYSVTATSLLDYIPAAIKLIY